MAARIPGEEVEVGEVQFIDEMRVASGMLVAAMEHDDGAASRPCGWPVAIEEVDVVVGAEGVFLSDALVLHCSNLSSC